MTEKDRIIDLLDQAHRMANISRVPIFLVCRARAVGGLDLTPIPTPGALEIIHPCNGALPHYSDTQH